MFERDGAAVDSRFRQALWAFALDADLKLRGSDSKLNIEDNSELRDAIAFVGDSLGPLFLQDPVNSETRRIIEAFASLDSASASADWPFGDTDSLTHAFARMSEGLQANTYEELVWEYRRLFVGPQTKIAPPWGSVYTDHDRVVFGASERELRRWMRERGIQLLANATDPADHIGTQLLMMSWIARSKPTDLADFLQLHLLPWAPHFLERVERQTHHPFYAGLAQLTSESLEGVRFELSIEVRYPRFYK